MGTDEFAELVKKYVAMERQYGRSLQKLDVAQAAVDRDYHAREKLREALTKVAGKPGNVRTVLVSNQTVVTVARRANGIEIFTTQLEGCDETP